MCRSISDISMWYEGPSTRAKCSEGLCCPEQPRDKRAIVEQTLYCKSHPHRPKESQGQVRPAAAVLLVSSLKWHSVGTDSPLSGCKHGRPAGRPEVKGCQGAACSRCSALETVKNRKSPQPPKCAVSPCSWAAAVEKGAEKSPTAGCRAGEELGSMAVCWALMAL